MTREEAINALKMMNLSIAHPFLHWEEMMEVRDMAIAALRAQQEHFRESTKMSWISVEDRLPKKLDVLPMFSERVLISTLCGIFTAQYVFSSRIWVEDANRIYIEKPFGIRCDDGNVTWECPPRTFDESMEVTHWMPLPEPPEEEHHEQ